MTDCNCHAPTRRAVLALGAAAVVLTRLEASAAADLPAEVAGVAIPNSVLASRVAAFARKSQPDFLFNHCMRVFLFGAITVKKMGMSYDPETAFYGSSLHDIGLLPAFASPNGSFEVDGADTAEKFLRDNGVAAPAADTVWHAIVLHDWRRKVTVRQGGDALVVAAGAGCDVGGPGSEVDAKQVEEILQAFPRLQFKVRFTDLLKDHCRRKPLSQSRSWLEGLCREQVPSAFTDTVEKDIAAAPFTE